MKEQCYQDTVMARIEAGHSPEPRKPLYIKSDERILRIVKNFDNRNEDETFLPYLKRIAHNVTF